MNKDNNEVKTTEAQKKPEFKNNKERLRWYVDEIDSYKEDMGRWYTWLVRRIIPLLVFFIPLNVITFRTYEYIANKYLGGLFLDMSATIGIVVWFLSVLIFLAVLVFLPRFATVCEFVFGFAFFAFVYRSNMMYAQGTIDKPIITNGLGWFVVIALALFLFMKLVFLVIEIIYHVVYRGEKEPKAYKSSDGDDLVL